MALLKKSYRWTFGLPLDFRFLPPQVQPFSHFVFLFVLFYQSFRALPWAARKDYNIMLKN